MSSVAPATPLSIAEEKRNWIGHALAQTGRYVFSPGEYFASISERPSWVPVFLAAGIAAILLAWWMLPFAARGMETAIPTNIPPERLDAFRDQMRIGQYTGVLFSPLILLVKAALSSVLLAMLTQVVLGQGTFRQMFSLVVHLLPFAELQTLHSLVVLRIRGVDAITSPMDVQVPFGLNLLVRDAPFAVNALLQSVNIYEVFAFCYLVIGIRAFLRRGERRLSRSRRYTGP